MRFVHLADTHLGFSAYTRIDSITGMNLREKQVYDNFLTGIEQIADLAPDAVIHAGDLFHYVKPKTVAMVVALEALDILTELDIPVIGIAGNHSMPKTRYTRSAFDVLKHHPGKILFANQLIYQSTTVDDATFHLIPNMLTPIQNQIEFKKIGLDPTTTNVLVMHGLAPNIARLNTVAEQEITPGMLDPRFEYIALGHIHNQQEVIPNVWYAGSQEYCTYGEVRDTKGGLLIEVEQGEPARVTHLDLPHTPMIELPTIDATEMTATEVIDEIIDLFNHHHPTATDDLVQIPVTNILKQTARAMDMNRLKEIRDRCLNLKVKIQTTTTTMESQTEKVQTVRGLNFENEFLSFIKNKNFPPARTTQIQKIGTRVLKQVIDTKKDEETA